MDDITTPTPAPPTIAPHYLAAAAWWGDTLLRPAGQNNGDFFQSALATLSQRAVAEAGLGLTPAERDRFVEQLATDLHNRRPAWVSVDYHPDGILSDALRVALGDFRAGQLDQLWSIKTNMYLREEEVRVSQGYGMPYTTIYPVSAPDDARG